MCLRVDNIEYDVLIHRLIANLFIPNPENKPEVDHIDGNKANNAGIISSAKSTTSDNNPKESFTTHIDTIVSKPLIINGIIMSLIKSLKE